MAMTRDTNLPHASMWCGLAFIGLIGCVTDAAGQRRLHPVAGQWGDAGCAVATALCAARPGSAACVAAPLACAGAAVLRPMVARDDGGAAGPADADKVWWCMPLGAVEDAIRADGTGWTLWVLPTGEVEGCFDADLVEPEQPDPEPTATPAVSVTVEVDCPPGTRPLGWTLDGRWPVCVDERAGDNRGYIVPNVGEEAGR